MPARPIEHTAESYERKTVTRTFSLYPRDAEMINELMELLGSNQSDVARTAIRTLYVKLLGKSA